MYAKYIRNRIASSVTIEVKILTSKAKIMEEDIMRAVHERVREGQEIARGATTPGTFYLSDCQHNLKIGINTGKVLHQHHQLIEIIRAQADANLRVVSQ